MSRSSRFLGLILVASYLSGCGSDTPPAPTGADSAAVQATAAKMPPPPGSGAAKKTTKTP